MVGQDAGTFLHSQLTQDVVSLVAGDSRLSLVLEPNGHVVCACEIICVNPQSFVLIVDPLASEMLIKRLSMYLIRTKAQISSLGDADLILGDENFGSQYLGKSASLPGTSWTLPGFDLKLEELGPYAYLALRAFGNWPRYGVEYDSGALPNLFGNLNRLVSFVKGCYTGQELVERVDSRGAAAPQVIYGCLFDSAPQIKGLDLYVGERLGGKVSEVCEFPPGEIGAFLMRMSNVKIDPTGCQVGFAILRRGVTPEMITAKKVGDEISAISVRSL